MTRVADQIANDKSQREQTSHADFWRREIIPRITEGGWNGEDKISTAIYVGCAMIAEALRERGTVS